MAYKILWKTGDTITADKLNGSSVFLMPVEFDENDAYVMPDVTAKQVVDALQAGAQPGVVTHAVNGGREQWNFNYIFFASYDSSVSPATVTVVFTDSGKSVELNAEYPDGTFSQDGK